MSIKHVVVCAECDKEVPAKVSYGIVTGTIGGANIMPASSITYSYPEGWLQLATCLGNGVTGCEYFCTYACIAKHAERRGS